MFRIICFVLFYLIRLHLFWDQFLYYFQSEIDKLKREKEEIKRENEEIKREKEELKRENEDMKMTEDDRKRKSQIINQFPREKSNNIIISQPRQQL